TKVFACIAAAALAFSGVVGVADARAKHKHKQHHSKKHNRPHKPAPPQLKPASFDGSCEFSGTVRFTPPLTAVPQPVAQRADAPGTCTGTFVDRYGSTHQLDNAAAGYRADSSGDSVSCAFGLASGTGT